MVVAAIVMREISGLVCCNIRGRPTDDVFPKPHPLRDRLSVGLSLIASFGNPLKVPPPFLFLVSPQLVEIVPRVEASSMAIIKYQLDCIMPDGLYRVDIDVFLTELQGLLTRAMALHLRRGRLYSQVLTR